MEKTINVELEMEMEENEVVEEDVDFEVGDEFENDEPDEPIDDETEVDLATNDLIDDEQELDLSEFTPSVCDQQGRVIGESGVMSVVNSQNGMRVSLSKDLMECLGNPQTVQIGFTDHQIAISRYLGEQYTSYSMSKSGPKSIIYRSELVKQITKQFMLDFTNRTSITFSELRYKQNDGNMIALIKVKL